MKKFKINAPIGTAIVPNEDMTEQQIRAFIPTLNQEPASVETWSEKAQNDPIENLIELLTQAGFNIEEIKP